MINAINMPNETISIKTLIISIGATSPLEILKKVMLRHPSCEARLLNFIITYSIQIVATFI